MTTMTRRLTAPRQAVQAASTCIDTLRMATVERTDGRTARSAGQDERAALRREYAWVEAAANAALRGRV